MQFSPTMLPEVHLLDLIKFRDERGFFREIFNAQTLASLGFTETIVQWNHSRSVPGVIRGIHFQHAPKQGKLVGVTRGAIIDVAVDLRPESPRFGQYVAQELSDENNQMLWIPAGFGHGFCVIGEVEADVVYGMSDHYLAGGESGVAYNDPELNIAWGIEKPIISERDKNQPSLAAAKPSLAQWFRGMK